MDKRKKRIPIAEPAKEQNIEQKASYGIITFPKSWGKEELSSCKLQIDDIQHNHTVV